MYVGECSQSSSIKNSTQLKVNWTFEDILSPIQKAFSVERRVGIPDTYILCWFTEYYIICGHLKGKMCFIIIYSFIKIYFKLKSIYLS